jgi:hypothetical protein
MGAAGKVRNWTTIRFPTPIFPNAPRSQIDGIMARIATKGLFQPDMERLFSEAERQAVGKEFEGWVMENFTKEPTTGVGAASRCTL